MVLKDCGTRPFINIVSLIFFCQRRSKPHCPPLYRSPPLVASPRRRQTSNGTRRPIYITSLRCCLHSVRPQRHLRRCSLHRPPPPLCHPLPHPTSYQLLHRRGTRSYQNAFKPPPPSANKKSIPPPSAIPFAPTCGLTSSPSNEQRYSPPNLHYVPTLPPSFSSPPETPSPLFSTSSPASSASPPTPPGIVSASSSPGYSKLSERVQAPPPSANKKWIPPTPSTIPFAPTCGLTLLPSNEQRYSPPNLHLRPYAASLIQFAPGIPNLSAKIVSSSSSPGCSTILYTAPSPTWGGGGACDTRLFSIPA